MYAADEVNNKDTQFTIYRGQEEKRKEIKNFSFILKNHFWLDLFNAVRAKLPWVNLGFNSYPTGARSREAEAQGAMKNVSNNNESFWNQNEARSPIKVHLSFVNKKWGWGIFMTYL